MTWSAEAREKPRGSGMSREEGAVELSVKSTAHLRPMATPLPLSIVGDADESVFVCFAPTDQVFRFSAPSAQSMCCYFNMSPQISVH